MLRSLLLAVTLGAAVAAWAGDRGFFGFALRTEFDGSFWNPVLAVASVAEVAPGSATARGGVAVGDLLLELEGISVPGAKDESLKQLKAMLEKDAHVGDRLRMQLRRASGEIYSVVLVAEPRQK